MNEITRLGLMIMPEEKRVELLGGLLERNRISFPAMVKLINAARDACYEMIDGEENEMERIRVRWMLSSIDGDEIVRSMDPDELAEWAVSLKRNGARMTADEYAEIVRAIMKME